VKSDTRIEKNPTRFSLVENSKTAYPEAAQKNAAGYGIERRHPNKVVHVRKFIWR
jgi:hypothetical protein